MKKILKVTAFTLFIFALILAIVLSVAFLYVRKNIDYNTFTTFVIKRAVHDELPSLICPDYN